MFQTGLFLVSKRIGQIPGGHPSVATTYLCTYLQFQCETSSEYVAMAEEK